MKNMYGIAREIAVDEQLSKAALLQEAKKLWGLSDKGTTKLYNMNWLGESYANMLAYFDEYKKDYVIEYGFAF